MSGSGDKEDVTRFVSERGLSITVPPSETPEEIFHRLESDRAEQEHKRKLELEEARHGRRVFWAFSAVLTIVMFLSFLIVLGIVSPGAGDDGQATEWSRTVISAIIAGLAGYLLPRSHR